MKAFLIAGVLALAAAAPVALAQDFTSDHYPRARVRMFKGDKHFPDPYYVTNRVVLRTVRLAAAGGGMQLSGDLLTDFDADRIPAGETQITPAEAPSGHGGEVRTSGGINGSRRVEVGPTDRFQLKE